MSRDRKPDTPAVDPRLQNQYPIGRTFIYMGIDVRVVEHIPGRGIIGRYVNNHNDIKDVLIRGEELL